MTEAKADEPAGPWWQALDAPLLISLGIAAVSALAFFELHESLAEQDRMVGFDSAVTDWVVAHRTAALTAVMRAVTGLADVRVVLLAVVAASLLLVRAHRRTLALLIVAATAGTWLLVNWGKLAIERARPPAIDRVVQASGYAFPSGHAGQGVALYCGLAVVAWLVTDRAGVGVAAVVGGAAIAIAIGCSRIYLGVHWTSDVLAGWALAISWLALLVAMTRVWRAHRTQAAPC